MLRKTSHRCHHSKKWGFQQHAEHTRLNSHQNYVLVDAVPLTSLWKLHKPLSPLLTHICHRTHSTRVSMFCVCVCLCMAANTPQWVNCTETVALALRWCTCHWRDKKETAELSSTAAGKVTVWWLTVSAWADWRSTALLPWPLWPSGTHH